MKYFCCYLDINYLHDFKQINLLLVEIWRGKIYLQVLFQQYISQLDADDVMYLHEWFWMFRVQSFKLKGTIF